MTASEPPAAALDLLHRWDAQQTAYIKYRDLRFATMLDMMRRVAPKNLRVLDLACGPGSLSAAIVAALPHAQVLALDKDPVLLAIARDVFAGNARVEIIEADLDDAAWLSGLTGEFDAVVSSTALHWLHPDCLARLYFQLAGRIRPGGVFLNADHLKYDTIAQPSLHRIAKDDDADNQAQALAEGADSWDDWWRAAKQRAALWAGKTQSPPMVTLGYHLHSLRSAGFSEVGTIWQYLDDYVVAAIR